MKLVLAPGAADASEGTVYLDEDNALCCKKAAEVSRSSVVSIKKCHFDRREKSKISQS